MTISPSGTWSRYSASFTSAPPSSSLSRSAVGRSESSGSRSFGRPRCAASRSRAPRPRSSCSVGSDALMRASSVILRSSSRGTLKSTRTRTRLPSTSRSSSVRTHEHLLGELHTPVGVAPLVVVPRDDLDEVALEHRGQLGVVDRAVAGLHDVGGDQRLVGVAQDAGEGARVGLRLEGLVDLL